LRAESTAEPFGIVARRVPAGMEGAAEAEATTRREQFDEVEAAAAAPMLEYRSSRISMASDTVTPASLRNRWRDSRGVGRGSS
jgi:hypothetical protein